MFKKAFGILMSCLMACGAQANIITRTVEYTGEGNTVMQGYLAYDDSRKGPLPAVVIFHDWMGLGEFTKQKARDLAQMGYVAFAADIYGKDTRPKNKDEAPKFAKKYRDDRKLLRGHVNAAYDEVTKLENVDKTKIVSMGYCFGGMAALELARSGTPLVGTAVFHGTLSSPTPQDAKNIKGKVLVMHGADDPNVPPAEVNAFKNEMEDARVDLKFNSYEGAVHAFTLPTAGKDKKSGVAYHEKADKESWQDFTAFLQEVTK